jgi:hypothetical protein
MPNHSDFLRALEDGVRARATAMEWACVRMVPGDRPNLASTSSMIAALGATPASRLGDQRPELSSTFLVKQSFHILMAVLPVDQSLVEFVRTTLWWAGYIRTELPLPMRTDVHLFIVLPLQAERDLEGQSWRNRLEGDERVCRKYVWLPGDQPSRSLDRLMDRTFLARPWEGPHQEPSSIDPLRRLIETAGLPQATSDRWVRALTTNDDATRSSLADELIKLHTGSDD